MACTFTTLTPCDERTPLVASVHSGVYREYRQASPAGVHPRTSAGRVQAMLGSAWATTIGLTRRALWRRPKEHAAPFPFVLADGGGDSIRVEVVSATDLFSELVEFLDDRIPALHEGLLAGSSSGVQMIGGFKPAERQTVSIVLRIVALARCLQFHVNRYVT